MDRLGYTRQNAALAGDLLEEYRNARSAAWYWRQTLMVIVHGVSRNAVAQVSYLGAVLAGFLAQTPVVFALWRLQSPSRVHGTGAIALATMLLVAGFVVADVVKRFMAGNWAVLWEIFSYYPLAYCICALFAPHFSLSELIVVELVWLTFQVTPVLVRVPSTGLAAAAEWPPPAGTAERCRFRKRSRRLDDGFGMSRNSASRIGRRNEFIAASAPAGFTSDFSRATIFSQFERRFSRSRGMGERRAVVLMGR